MTEFTKTDLYALRKIWGSIEDDNTFGSFEGFVQWAQGKRKPGFTPYKIKANEPYSPYNAYWYYQTRELPVTESPFCAGCPDVMKICNTIGCLKYREGFVQNWNKNICRKPKEVPKEPQKKEYFRYEHPDLVREGIVWTWS